MRTQPPDTSPEAEQMLIDLLRRAPAWRKLALTDLLQRAMDAAGLPPHSPGQ